jgi:hypothetical protein
MMPTNEELVRELYAAAEGSGKDIAKFLSFFSDEGYMCDISSGMKFYGQDIGDSINAFASAFPDVHRELFDIYVADSCRERYSRIFSGKRCLATEKTVVSRLCRIGLSPILNRAKYVPEGR